MRLIFCFLAALMAPRCAHSFAPVVGTSRKCSNRRAASMTLPGGINLNRALGTVLVSGALLTGVVGGAGVARADLSISPRCITGEGAQCDDLAEGSELIKTLQARSALSKDRYIAETLDTYNQHNFKGPAEYLRHTGYFKAEGKHMVKHKSGKYEILTNAEYANAEKAGKVKSDNFLGED
ncbi:unnamed protein product [Pylaiella littoralis]